MDVGESRTAGGTSVVGVVSEDKAKGVGSYITSD
jgi:hypothetical protein